MSITARWQSQLSTLSRTEVKTDLFCSHASHDGFPYRQSCCIRGERSQYNRNDSLRKIQP